MVKNVKILKVNRTYIPSNKSKKEKKVRNVMKVGKIIENNSTIKSRVYLM